MSQFYFPFDAVETEPGVFDREYTAAQFSDFLKTLFSSGVMPGALTLQAYLSDTRTVAIRSGEALIEGAYYSYDDEGGLAVVSFVAPTAHATLLRIDRVVLRLDRRISARSVVLAYLTGTASATPTPPALTRDDDVFEISLARIQIQPNTTIISSEDVIDEREDTAVCGRTTSLAGNPRLALGSRVVVTDANGVPAASPGVTTTELGYLDGVTSAIQTQINGKQATVTGAASTVTSSNLAANKALLSDASGKIGAATVTATELGHLSGVTSAIQTQINGKQDAITGAASTVTASNLTGLRALYSDANGKIAASSLVTATELNYLDGVTSGIQGQLDGKQATITGAASTVASSNLAASRALYSDASGKIAAAAVTSTELGYLDGVTSAIQTQLNGKQATITGAASTVVSSNLTASRIVGTDTSGKLVVSATGVLQLDSLTFDYENLTPSRALYVGSDGRLYSSAVTSTELGYLDGVTSAIQTQLNGKVSLPGTPPVYTREYSTANRTITPIASSNVTSSVGGTPSTSVAAVVAGSSYSQADMVAVKNGLSTLIQQHNYLRNDMVDTLQALNAVITDLVARGMLEDGPVG